MLIYYNNGTQVRLFQFCIRLRNQFYKAAFILDGIVYNATLITVVN